MNGKMWNHPATQRNLLQLKNDGVTVIDPAEGELACGYQGIGRLAEIEDILSAILGENYQD
jgi:phosphopantothenoylcysteine synthetase/decarboxylase